MNVFKVPTKPAPRKSSRSDRTDNNEIQNQSADRRTMEADNNEDVPAATVSREPARKKKNYSAFQEVDVSNIIENDRKFPVYVSAIKTHCFDVLNAGVLLQVRVDVRAE